MTKTKSQRERAKAERKAAAATAATVIANKVAKSAKSKKKFSWMGLLKGAAKTAAELAPVVLPALLANHGPTQQAIQTHQLSGGTPLPAMSSGIAPLASAAPLESQVGVFGMSSVSSGGRVVGVRLKGMDYVGDVTLAAAASKGDVLFELDLNPRGTGWQGTRVQRESTLYERFKVNRMAGMYEASCPATTEGQIIAFFDTDPDEEFDVTGTPAVQRAASHAGSEVGQVWQMVCAEYRADKDTQAYYADANGSDVRLVSPGVLRIIAATDLDPGTYGAVYMAYDIEFSVPQVEDAGYVGHYAHLNSTGTLTNPNPIGNGTWDDQVAAGGGANFTATYSTTNGSGTTVSTYYGLPVGTYDVIIQISGASLSTQSATNYAIGPVTGSAYAINFNATKLLTVATGSYVVFELTVSEDTTGNINRGWVSFNNQGGTPTFSKVTFLQKPAGLTLSRRMTLKDYERATRNLIERLAVLEDALMSRSSPNMQLTTTSLPRAFGGSAMAAMQQQY